MAYTRQEFINDKTIIKAEHFIHIEEGIANSQEKLVSGTNIKTVNGESILGSGNITVEADVDLSNTQEKLVSGTNIKTINGKSVLGSGDIVIETDVDLSSKQDTLVSGSNIKTINGQSILGEGDITIEGGSADLSNMQEKLVSGTNIKTINGQSILGSGNITIEGGSGSGSGGGGTADSVEWNNVQFNAGAEEIVITYDESHLDANAEMLKYDPPANIEDLLGASVVVYVDGEPHNVTIYPQIFSYEGTNSGTEVPGDDYDPNVHVLLGDASSTLGVSPGSIYIDNIEQCYIVMNTITISGKSLLPGIYITPSKSGNIWIESITYTPYSMQKLPVECIPQEVMDSIGYLKEGEYEIGALWSEILLDWWGTEGELSGPVSTIYAFETTPKTEYPYYVAVCLSDGTLVGTPKVFTCKTVVNDGNTDYYFGDDIYGRSTYIMNNGFSIMIIGMPYNGGFLGSVRVDDDSDNATITHVNFFNTFGITEETLGEHTITDLKIQFAEAKPVYKTIDPNFMPAKSVTVTLTADGWVGEVIPYTQEVSVPGITEDTFGMVGVADSATTEEYTAATKAQLRKTGQKKGVLTISCYSSKPSIDIPITVSGLWN